MHQPTLLCLTVDNWIAIVQVAATLIVGLATIMIYLRITAISANATRHAGEIAAEATEAAAKLSERNLLFNKLNQDLDRIIEFTIQYPYFEDESYTKHEYRAGIVSNSKDDKEKALRYELFAMMNFNFVEDLYKYFNGDEEKMGNVAYFQELIVSHAEYWKYKIIEKKEGGYTLITALANRILNIKQQL